MHPVAPMHIPVHTGVPQSEPGSEKWYNLKIALIPQNARVTSSNSELVIFQEVDGCGDMIIGSVGTGTIS